MLQNRGQLRGGDTVRQSGEILVAGVGERLLGSEGDVTLWMGAGKFMFVRSLDDAQVAPAKNRGLRQHFALLQGSGQE